MQIVSVFWVLEECREYLITAHYTNPKDGLYLNKNHHQKLKT